MKNKHQHMIPRAYLQRFASNEAHLDHEPALWVFNRSKGSVFRKSPKNVEIRSFYYTYIDSDGNRNDAVDELLQEIENRGLPVLLKLDRGADPTSLSDEERASAAYFIASLQVRVPAFRDSAARADQNIAKIALQLLASHPKHFEEALRQAAEKSGLEPPIDVEAVRQISLSDKLIIKANPDRSLAQMVQ